MANKKELYFNQRTGNIARLTKSQAKRFSDEWHKVLFVKDENGEDVMRFTFTDPSGARATVTVSDNGQQEVNIDGSDTPTN
jgi:hypothetical protein